MYNFYLELLILIIFATPGLESTTIKEYCKLSQFHTMCLYPTDEPAEECGRVISANITNEERKLIVNLHNHIRRKMARGAYLEQIYRRLPTVSNMMKVGWDKELEQTARRWALQCQNKHDRNRDTLRWKVGQNVHVDSSDIANWTDVITAFMEEFQAPEFDINYSSPNNAFMTMTWVRAYAIGCGKVTFVPNKEYYPKKQTLFVCNYGPREREVISSPLRGGKPCSGCPISTYCDRGLCVNTNKSMISGEFHGNVSADFYKLFLPSPE